MSTRSDQAQSVTVHSKATPTSGAVEAGFGARPDESEAFIGRLMVGAPGGSPAEALAESAFALRASVDSLRGYESEGWAHFAFTRINTTPTFLPKKIEDLREVRASRSIAG